MQNRILQSWRSFILVAENDGVHLCSMEDCKLIDYDHTRDGSLCNGIMSDYDVRPEVIWTYDRHGRSVTRTEPVTEAAFATLWDGIAASLKNRGVFWRCLVTDPSCLIDPEAGHVIVATSGTNGHVRHLTFVIPADEADPEFTTWLRALGVPAVVSSAAEANILVRS